MKTLKEICDAGIVVNNGEMYYFKNIDDAIEKYKEINTKVK